MLKIAYFLLFFVILSSIALANADFASFCDEVGYVYSEGLYDKPNLYTSIGFGAAWAGTFPNDEELLGPIGGYGERANDAAEVLNYSGKFHYVFGISAITWGAGYIFGWDEISSTGRDLTAAVLLSSVNAVLVKAVVGRVRPRMRMGAYEFELFTTDDDWQSLPSGDAAVAFAWASVLTERTRSWPIAIGSYTLATAASWSRINKRGHWPSDICLGALIGILYGRACGKYGRVISEESPEGLNVGMYIDPGTGFAGVQLSW